MNVSDGVFFQRSRPCTRRISLELFLFLKFTMAAWVSYSRNGSRLLFAAAMATAAAASEDAAASAAASGAAGESYSYEYDGSVPPMPNDSTWELMRSGYLEVIRRHSGDSDNPKDVERIKLASAMLAAMSSPTRERYGIAVEHEIRYAPETGRGIYAAQNIPAGAVVMQDLPIGYFVSEEEWQDFLFELPCHLRYDSCEWAYLPKGEEYLSLDFGPAALVNHGKTKRFTIADHLPNECNIAYDPTLALRDIKIGEEILLDYSDFHDYERQHWYEETCEDEVVTDCGIKKDLLVVGDDEGDEL